jgi:hypothetical protein
MLMAGVGDLCVVPTSEKAGCLPARKKRSTKAGLAVAGSNCWKEVTGPRLEGEKEDETQRAPRAFCYICGQFPRKFLADSGVTS